MMLYKYVGALKQVYINYGLILYVITAKNAEKIELQ